MFALLLTVGPGCKEETTNIRRLIPVSSDEEIEDLVESAQPLFAVLRQKSTLKLDMEMISYEIVKDRRTRKLALLNFRSEPFFPIARREDYVRVASYSYTVECSHERVVLVNRNGTSPLCAHAIGHCLDAGGCSALTRTTRVMSAITKADEQFFADRGLNKDYYRIFNRMTLSDLEVAVATGSLSSVKLYTLIIQNVYPKLRKAEEKVRYMNGVRKPKLSSS